MEVVGAANLTAYNHTGDSTLQGSEVIDFAYTASLPAGWDVTNRGVAVTAAAQSNRATISVDCRRGVDKRAMLTQDAFAAAQLGIGAIDAGAASAATVGDEEALIVSWSGSESLGASHVSAYVDGPDCAWRLQLTAFAPHQLAEFDALFRAVLDAFDPMQGLRH